jgi:hypothetical protein
MVRTIRANGADVLLLRDRMDRARIDTGTLGMSASTDRTATFRYDLHGGNGADVHEDRQIVGPAEAPVVDRWLEHGFGREPIDLVNEALNGAVAPDAVRHPPDDLRLAVLGMVSTLVGETEDARIVVRCPTPWSAGHVMVGRDEPEGTKGVFRYRMHDARSNGSTGLLGALPIGTHLRTDRWSTSLNAIDVEYHPGDLDSMTRLRALSAWASWRD